MWMNTSKTLDFDFTLRTVSHNKNRYKGNEYISLVIIRNCLIDVEYIKQNYMLKIKILYDKKFFV